MKQIQLKQGTISYDDLGEGLGIIFLHGALSNSYTWKKILEPLSANFRCIAPTLPLGGHTIPLHDSADLTPFGIADLLLDFIDALKLEQVVLVANDTGGAYAQVFAAKYPDKVRGLVLSNCDALDVFPPAQFASLQRFIDMPLYTDLMAVLFRLKPILKTQWVLGLLSSRLSQNEIYKHYVKGFIDNAGVRSDFKKVARAWSVDYTQEAAQMLAQLTIPTLLLWGAEDKKLFPASLAERLHKTLAGSQLIFIDGAMTYVQVDQPKLFIKHTQVFLDKL